MSVWVGVLYVAVGAVGALLVLVYTRRRLRSKTARREVERPNSAYDPPKVRSPSGSIWAAIDLAGLHPINREEVERLLDLADAAGPDSLAPRERSFLDTLASWKTAEGTA